MLRVVSSEVYDESRIEVIYAEMARIFSCDHFKSSRRAQSFLKYVVEHCLTNPGEEVGERSIATALFGRHPDYDCTEDAIVRVTAHDVRKRLTKFYEADAQPFKVRIEIPLGAYTPEFHFAPEPVLAGQPRRIPFLRRHGRVSVLAGLMALTLLSIAVSGRFAARHQTALERFWEPFLQDSNPVVVVGGVGTTYRVGDNLYDYLHKLGTSHPKKVALPPIGPYDLLRFENEYISVTTAHCVFDLIVWLERQGKRTQFRPSSDLVYQDQLDRPVVLVGAFNNPWTLQLNRELRFAFDRVQGSDHFHLAVVDQWNPQRRWVVSGLYPEPANADYAIVSRLIDPASGRLILCVAGVNRFGTDVAAHYVIDPAAIERLTRSAGADWNRHSLQVVLETGIVNQIPSPPKVVAAQFWQP